MDVQKECKDILEMDYRVRNVMDSHMDVTIHQNKDYKVGL